MSNQIKNGRIPLSQKRPVSFSATSQFGNRLGVDEALHKEITEQGMEYRWIDAKKLYANQGYHQNGWQAYKRKNATTEFKNGNDPDGIIRRGSSILGVRSKDLGDEHRTYLKDRANRMSGSGSQKAHADELRKMAGKSGIKVEEGYGEDDGDDE